MSGRRPMILMSVLLVLLLGYLGRPWWTALVSDAPSASPPPLAGANRIVSVQIQQQADGRWFADVEYFYTGDPPLAEIRVASMNQSNLPASSPTSNWFVSVPKIKIAVRGTQRVGVEIRRPPVQEAVSTTHLVTSLFGQGRTLASLETAQRIDWPDFETMARELQWGGKSKEELLDAAIGMIDAGDRRSLQEGKGLLERLLTKDPRYPPGLVEMARHAMKTNWGPEGREQAETYLLSALRMQPDNVNAQILLGYVRAHQGRYKDAEQLFTEASRTDTKNLWLWANWGELFELQRRIDPAVEKYRVALSAPRSKQSHDHARIFAYERLLLILEQRRDIGGLEALHRRRIDEYSERGCYAAAYARFLLVERADAAGAIASGRQALSRQCETNGARDVLGMAYYSAWSIGNGPERDDALNQARIFLPPGPRQTYLLATSDNTAKVLKQLISSGDRVDRQDNEKFNALAYAFQNEDLAAVRRLVRLGAKLEAPVGADGLPAALIPVVSRDLQAIKLMQQLGVDYSKLRHQGMTAFDIARQTGDRKLLDALDRKANAL